MVGPFIHISDESENQTDDKEQLSVAASKADHELDDEELQALHTSARALSQPKEDTCSLDEQIRALVQQHGAKLIQASLERVQQDLAERKRKLLLQRHSTTDLPGNRSASISPPLYERSNSTNAINIKYLVNHFVDKVQLNRQSKTIQTQEQQKVELERKRAREQRLKAAILDAAFDAMLAYEVGTGKISLLNQRACEQFGYSEAELIGKSIDILFGVSEDAEPWPLLDLQLDHDGATREVWAKRKDESEFPAMLGIQLVESFEDDKETELLVAFVRDIAEEKRSLQLVIENKASESLLLNMLPQEIVYRLKEDPSTIAEYHSDASLLFADICGFTEFCAQKEAVDIVNILNELFTRFDSITDEYGLNKVKTIGDCYMVTDIPHRLNDDRSCGAVCQLALEMNAAMEDYNLLHPNEPLRLRIGINRGPVVAGIVGKTRFLYDLWGDAVNIASRMESSGIVGRVQVTQSVVDQTSHAFEFESRGEISVKGLGLMETFLLKGVRNDDLQAHKDFFVKESSPSEKWKALKRSTTSKEGESWRQVLSTLRSQPNEEIEHGFTATNLHRSLAMFTLDSEDRHAPPRSRSSFV